ncbi:MAG: 4-(cytidine 5'-diphospho)-2-C-methyl-D-erythritol kinase [Candidatus Omnitrophica bacterium]|nr:4-(cytidine 5'-diphospho)-2-C-methyl-D-erythritol kinase [Candidatus Omnitrophota bacterium]
MRAVQTIKIKSPSKLNLFLKIIRRLPDGYHELVTLFHRISLCDNLVLKRIPEGFGLKCQGIRLDCGEENLITQAYRLLKREFPQIKGVQVTLKKNIFLEAGLGGGSSNAASFLLGVIKLYRLKLPQKKLMALGKSLGADVPFFLMNVNQALGTGVGERLRKYTVKKKTWFLLVLSKKGLSTKKVYQTLPRKLPSASLTKALSIARLITNFLKGEDCLYKAVPLQNDLEPPAFFLRPSLQKDIAKIKSLGGRIVGMSGSGPTIFVVLSSRREGVILAKRLSRMGRSKKIILCHTY